MLWEMQIRLLLRIPFIVKTTVIIVSRTSRLLESSSIISAWKSHILEFYYYTGPLKLSWSWLSEP